MSGLKRMPKGVNSLHWINGFSTFSYAVMFSSLALYLSKELGFSQHLSNSTVGLFLALNFTLHVVAGYLGDRYVSNKNMLLISALSQAIGVILLGFYSSHLIYFALAFILIGCGIGSTNLNCLLTQRFSEDDKRREVAFMVNYWALNIGFFIAFFASGYFDLQGNYKNIFILSSIFNLLTICIIAFSWRLLPTSSSNIRKRDQNLGYFFILLIIPTVAMAFFYSSVSNYLIMVVGAVVLFGILLSGIKSQSFKEKKNIYTFFILTVSSIVFWALFYVGPIGLVHFLEYNVNSNFYNYKLPTQWLMELNSVFVIVLSPVLAFMLYKAQQKGIVISVQRKFIAALICIAFSFFILSLGIVFQDVMGQVSLAWVIVHYFFQAVGELLLAPVGNAMIGELVPRRLQGFMMGAWMMVSGISAVIAHHFSNMMTITESSNPLVSNPYFYSTFNKLGVYTLVTSLFVYFFTTNLKSYLGQKMQNNTTEVECF